MKKRKIYIIYTFIIIIAFLFSISRMTVNSNERDAPEYQHIRSDLEVAMAIIDDLSKEQPVPIERLNEIDKIIQSKKDEYLNYKTEDKLERDLAMSMASGFSMLEKSIGGYSYNSQDSDHNLEQARKEFCRVLRIFNEMSLDKK